MTPERIENIPNLKPLPDRLANTLFVPRQYLGAIAARAIFVSDHLDFRSDSRLN
jgi:hypothetical protein